MTIQRMLITGTSGFVGRNLKEYFQGRVPHLYCPNRATLNLLDSDAVLACLAEQYFDVVIHCGVTLGSVEENLKMYFNLERGSERFGRMICIGSGAEYDMRNYLPGMKEEYFRSCIPMDIYGFSKYVIANDIENRPRNIYNLRVFGIFGPYENYKRRFISNNICRVLCGLDLSVVRNMRFDFLWIADFIAMLELFLEGQPLWRSYNICSGQSPDLVSILHLIREVHGRDVPVTIHEEGFKQEYSGDNSRFLQEFGWNRYTDLKRSIADLYDWYRNSSGLTFHSEMFQ
ncbi:MAG: NAD(P)-dependent oxidoreductase [Magnetococcales bacterium]|nr:NAD(P)-dependent oxidoreductase [Magnetococcales bacterium]